MVAGHPPGGTLGLGLAHVAAAREQARVCSSNCLQSIYATLSCTTCARHAHDTTLRSARGSRLLTGAAGASTASLPLPCCPVVRRTESKPPLWQHDYIALLLRLTCAIVAASHADAVTTLCRVDLHTQTSLNPTP